MGKTVGVLALQGAYQKHIDMLHTMRIATCTVRQPHELNHCSALVLPGGESTTISLLIQEYGLYDPIKIFAEEHPVMGVCAGMIMMATEVDDERITPLELLPFKALRNHYGRQAHSFTTDIKLNFDNSRTFPAHFIRAPGFGKLPAEIEVLATYNDEVIMIGAGKHVALSLHPELTDDTRIHDYWLRNLNKQTSAI